MKAALLALTAAAGTAIAQQQGWGQCGGKGFTGSTKCVSGYTCHTTNEYYAQCIPSSGPAKPTKTTVKHHKPTKKPTKKPHKPTTTAKPTTAKATTVKPTTVKPTTTKPTTTQQTSSPTGGSGSGVPYAGVNIAGFDFGCGTDGTCTVSGAYPPTDSNGLAQMDHFVNDDGLNTLRLPVGWQYLVNGQIGNLDSTNFGKYDKLMQGCLSSGAELCIIDIHNYARWNGQVIGQGGPTNAQFADLWSQLATKYKSQSKIAFGIMNEPHDLDIGTWATSVQAAVTAIRKAGATSQKILLPGTNYASAEAFLDNGSGAALSKVTNPDGSTTNLIFDVHKYLDSDNSGTHAECTTNNVAAFTTLGDWLRKEKRQAILTETGGGANEASCLKALCEQFATMNKYGDVYLGWTGWSAGNFDASYVLGETPTQNGNSWTDQPLVKQCVVGQFHG
ncbi:uncharacterized protein LTR77_008177 [Saxophila tyrrhenica]|uniref:Endoglucanase EG-II n=1 Tax=Saxophila tyrrhenica TaxID=1690608 RepID=A0AAV9P5F1_9PEZI|nr:hypothetical protein LTR77_008177 [Saxophila tyrrhenica]